MCKPLEHCFGLHDRALFNSLLGRSIDQHVVASATFARVLWLKGERDAALQISERCVAEARSQDQAIVTCYVLIEASIPIALLSSERKRASEAISLLHETSTRVGLPVARACSRAFNAYLLSLDNPTTGHLSEFSAAIADMDALGMGAHAPMLAAQYATVQALSGRRDEALSTIASMLVRCEENGNMWFASELHRIRGELLSEDLSQPGVPSVGERALTAERCFISALEISSNQGALSFQLRAALSFARLLHARGCHAEALNCLERVLLFLPENCQWPEIVEVAELLRLARESLMSPQRHAVARNIADTSSSSDGGQIESELTDLTLTKMLQVNQLDWLLGEKARDSDGYLLPHNQGQDK
jgi:tetratricopeptide (TPR) repeat protein